MDRKGLARASSDSSSQLIRDFEEETARERAWVDEQMLLARRNSSLVVATSTQRQSTEGRSRPDMQGELDQQLAYLTVFFSASCFPTISG